MKAHTKNKRKVNPAEVARCLRDLAILFSGMKKPPDEKQNTQLALGAGKTGSLTKGKSK